MTKLTDLGTPALILDRRRLKANIEGMAAHARRLGIPLRPHLKTPKSAQVAELLRTAGANCFCVSTLQEAEYFLRWGFPDLFYCVPFAPAKMRRAIALVEAGCELLLMTDSIEGARCCVEAAERAAAGAVLSFVLEIDVDGYRTGMPPESERVLAAARCLENSAATRFAGLMSYAGASYGDAPKVAAERGEHHCRALREMADALEAAGLACPLVSLGSTPAVRHSRALPGVTELRCGIYVFQDLFQAGIGAACIDDIAVSVLATVISRQPQHNRFVIDAGALALSKDRSTGGHPFDAGYGLVCDVVSGQPLGDLAVISVSQELGLVSSLSGSPIDLDSFPVGTRLRVLPNHADMTAAAYDSYHVIDGTDEVVEVWDRCNGW